MVGQSRLLAFNADKIVESYGFKIAFGFTPDLVPALFFAVESSASRDGDAIEPLRPTEFRPTEAKSDTYIRSFSDALKGELVEEIKKDSYLSTIEAK